MAKCKNEKFMSTVGVDKLNKNVEVAVRPGLTQAYMLMVKMVKMTCS